MTNVDISSGEYALYSFENVNNFKNYIKGLGIDIYDKDDVIILAEYFNKLYENAIEKGIIQKIDNDILLVKNENIDINNIKLIQKDDGSIVGVTPMWAAGKTLEDANNGTHQVITRDALNVVAPLFPNFFLKNFKGIFIT